MGHGGHGESSSQRSSRSEELNLIPKLDAISSVSGGSLPNVGVFPPSPGVPSADFMAFFYRRENGEIPADFFKGTLTKVYTDS